MDTDVLVVGAGPTGLMLANQLVRPLAQAERRAETIVQHRDEKIDEGVIA